MEQIIFNNICKEIMRECKNRSIKVSERFIAYYVKLLILEPRWNISLETLEINRIDLQNLVKHTYTTLEDELNASVIALKMQMYFTCSFDTEFNIVWDHRRKLDAQLSPLENEILNTASDGNEDYDKLFRQIVSYLTLKHGLGNPAIPPVYLEAQCALGSVFNRDDLNAFLAQPDSTNKTHILEELSGLVCGIRLFNRDCGKGGHGIEDLPSLLSQAIAWISDELQKALLNVMEIVNLVTTALDVCYKVEVDEDKVTLNMTMAEDPKYSRYIESVKDILVVFRQYEVFIRKMSAEVERVKDKARSIFVDFEDCLKQIHGAVLYKTIVQASIIYPHFMRLANIWYLMQNEVIYLSAMNQILDNLRIYSEQVNRYEDMLMHLLGNKPVLTDADRMEKIGMYRMASLGCRQTKILNPNRIPHFDTQPLQLLGFCLWKFVESEGALIPGNPGNGVAEVNKRYYVFSCLEAVQSFVKQPERYIHQALMIARTKPELIHFLQLYEQLEEVKTVHSLVPEIVATIQTNEVECQTEEHMLKSNIDPSYMWNIWDWKRQALKLADISKRITKSTQTEQSNYKNSIKVQTHFNKDHSYQTKTDNYSNVPTPLTYIFGLRGRKDDKQFIITLTRPVEE